MVSFRVAALVFGGLSLVSSCSFEGAPSTSIAIDAAGVDSEVRLCGNAEIDDGESCDDANAASGDGCSAACSVEPGFECTEIGVPCVRVNAITWNDALPGSGRIGASTGGSTFCTSSECDCGSDSILVGLQGGFRTNPASEGVAQLQVLCASLSFGLDGVAKTGDPVASSPVGNGQIDSPVTALCPDGAAISGLRGLNMSDGGYVGGLEIDCTPLSHAGGTLVLGDAAGQPERIGAAGTLTESTVCSADQPFAVGLVGSSGNVVDTLAVRCAAIEAVAN